MPLFSGLNSLVRGPLLGHMRFVLLNLRIIVCAHTVCTPCQSLAHPDCQRTRNRVPVVPGCVGALRDALLRSILDLRTGFCW